MGGIIGLTMLGAALPDGNSHAMRWVPDRLDTTIVHITKQAANRSEHLELNALVQAIVDNLIPSPC
ncbi:MAG: hypothetical protein ACP5HZ_10985 [Ferrimicrobium sp.]